MYNNSKQYFEIRNFADENSSNVESSNLSSYDDKFDEKLVGDDDNDPTLLRFSKGFDHSDSDVDFENSEILNPIPESTENSSTTKNIDQDKKFKISKVWNQSFLKDKLCIIIFLSLSLLIRVASNKLLIPNIFTIYVKNQFPNDNIDEITSMASKYKSVSDALPYVANFLLSPLLGVVSDRYGRKKILALITATQIIDMVVVGFTFWFNIIWPFYISHALAGITNCSLPIALSYLADLTTKNERSIWFMIVGASVGISVACGPVLEMFLIKLYSYNAAVMGNVGLLLVSFLFLIPVVESIKYIEGEPKDPIIDQFGNVGKERLGSLNPFKPMIRLFTSGRFMTIYSLLYFAFAYSCQDTINTAYYYTSIRYGWGALQNSLNTSAVGVSVFIWSFFVLPLTLKFVSERKIVIVAFLLSTIFHVIYAYAFTQWIWAVSLSLGSFSLVLLNLVQSIISKATPSHIQGGMLTGVSALSSLSSAVGAFASQNIFAYFISSRAPIYFPGMHFLINSGIIFLTFLASIYAERLPNPEETTSIPSSPLKKSLLEETTIN